MAILHGSWIPQPHTDSVRSQASPPTSDNPSGAFFIWGEVWQRVEPVAIQPGEPIPQVPYPYAMEAEDLRAWLRSLHQSRQIQWTVADAPLEVTDSSGSKRKSAKSATKSTTAPWSKRWHSIPLALPTYRSQLESGGHVLIPQHSATDVSMQQTNEGTNDTAPAIGLHSWTVPGLWLTITEALPLLQSLPLSSVQDEQFSWQGADLRFWSHIVRWHLDLLARSKFLPQFAQQTEESAEVSWQVLLDSAVDQGRLEKFIHHMPGACRAYGTQLEWMEIHALPAEAVSPAPSLLFSFLNQAIDTQVRVVAATQPLPTLPLKDIPLREWLQALGNEPRLTGEAAKLERLATTLSQWIAPLKPYLTQKRNPFRTCFYLHPPLTGSVDWTLEYCLQAVSDPDLIVKAQTVWDNPVERLVYQGRVIEQPQETLLAGLGLASRLYAVIEPSLQTQQPRSCSLHPLQVYEFLRNTAWRLQDSGFGVIMPPSLANQEGWANRLGLKVKAEPPKSGKDQRLGLQSLLNFKWELTIGGQRLSKREFDRLVALNTPLVEINGGWVELRSQDIKAAQAFFENRKEQMSLSLEDALRISTGDTQMIEKLPVVDFEASGSLQELINTLTTGNQSVEPIEVPETFRGTLRPYQVRGASWLAFLERWGLGACLADDMGLGKTIQFIALMLHLQAQDALRHPTLLVCPTSVLGNWEREVKRFGPTLNIVVHHGDRRSQGKAFAKAMNGKHLVITSYSLVHRDLKDLQAVSWQGIVLDEAQNVKNADAKQSQAVRQLDAQFRIALTGTPVENRLSELWSIMEFLNPGYLGPKNFFQRRFAIPIERYGDTASLKTLRSLVQPFILRRLKTDRSIIQDLPEKQEMTVFCALSADQAALYQQLVEDSLVAIESSEGIQRRGMILALLTKLKQVCNHPMLYERDETKKREALQPSAFRTFSGKLQRLDEMLEELLSEGDRALIFTQFAEWGKLLQTHLAQTFKQDVLFLYGSTSKPQREAMIDRFQNDPQAPRIFILSLKAGGVGLNLTRANHVFHFDRWWNPAVENQATDRVFRIGQTRNVQVHKFVCTGTLEERIHELIESKKALSEQVVGTGENWLTELDTDALRNLLLLDRAAVIEEDE